MRWILSTLFTLSATAADFAGPWQFSYKTSSGVAREGVFNLKIEGDQVTGTITSNRGTIKIDDGNIHGDDIAFRVVCRGNGDEIEVRYEGKLENGILKLTMNYRTHSPIAITATHSLPLQPQPQH